MRIGSIVYATEQGLGYLAKAFWDHGILTDVVVLHHTRRRNHPEWYTGHPMVFRGHYQSAEFTQTTSHLMRAALQRLIDKVDVLLFFETPFNWDAFTWARERGKKVILMPMHECMPDPLPCWPDLMLCPSLLDLDWADSCRVSPPITPNKSPAMFLPVPAPDANEVAWHRRGEARVFVHNAGHGGLLGRNGTAEVFAAWDLVKSPAKLIVRSQGPLRPIGNLGNLPVSAQLASFCNPAIDVRVGTFDRATLYEEGEVFLFPERFNGLSLPLQEAYASGMLVMAADRYPVNTWLPGLSGPLCCPACDSIRIFPAVKSGQDVRVCQVCTYTFLVDAGVRHTPLIPVESYRKNRVSHRFSRFDEALIKSEAIAAKVDEWYDRDVSFYSEQGRGWAHRHSWKVLGPKYLEVVEGVLNAS